MILKDNHYNGIIIFGEMGSGKDTFADYLIKTNIKCCKYNIGGIIREFFSIIKINPSLKGKNRYLGQTLADKLREVYPQILNDYCLSLIYEKWEKDFHWQNDDLEPDKFEKILLEQLKQIKEYEIPIIVGGRTYDDFNYWVQKNFLTIGVICNPEVRFSRLCKRDGFEIAQNSNFKHNTEIDVADISKTKCTIIVDNSYDDTHLINEAKNILKLF